MTFCDVAGVGTYSVYKRGDSPYWWISYDGAKGRVWISSKQRRDDPLGYKRALDIARSHNEDEAAVAGSAASGAWESWVPAWLERKFGAPEKVRTLRTELHRWRWVHAFLTERGIGHPGAVSYQVGMEFLTWRQQHKTRAGKGGFNNALGELHFLARAMREAVRAGFITASPLERMGLTKRKPAEKPEISDAEVAAIRAELQKREGHLPIVDRWMTVSFELAIHQGCRFAETSLPMSEIDLDRGTITFRQKGDRLFTTKLHDGLRPLITELIRAKAKRTCTHPDMASKRWHWFFKGRREKDCNTPGVAPRLCFHCTRVTVITRLARAGVPMAQAMAYVGHADQAIHRIYQRLKAQDLTLCTDALASLSSGSSRSQGAASATPPGRTGSTASGARRREPARHSA